MPKVSVIVPVYNAEKFLHQCIDSILGQTLQDLEVICVNDGSTDDSLAILQDYAAKDARVKVITKPNAGYGHSMNMGLDAATGEYMGIVDSDDYILPDMYKTLYDLAKKDDLDFVRGGYYKFYEVNGEEKKTYWSSMGGKYTGVVYCPRKAREFYLSAVLTPSGIYNIEFLRRNGVRYNESPGAAFQDQGFWFITHALADRALFITDAFYMYRFDNPNSSIYSRSSLRVMSGEYDYIKEFVDKHKQLEYVTTPFYWKARFLNCKIIYSRLVREIGPKTAADLVKPFRDAKQNGTLDYSFFNREQLNSLNQLTDDVQGFCNALKLDTAHSLYLEHISRDLNGVDQSRIYQFSWYRKRFGLLFASKVSFRRVGALIKERIKRTGKRLHNLREKWKTKTNPVYAKQKTTINQMATFLAGQKDREYRDNQRFWWSINHPGETITETKQRFFLNMPKAEGPLRKRQEEYIAVLEELKRVLDENGIAFWPMGGTMIGMLRHKGFVPWDDDIDISMMYEDKERLYDAVKNSGTLKVEEVYWCGNTVLRCPRVTFIDSARTGLVDVFLWERANDEPTGFAPLWNKRNRHSALMNADYRKIKPKLHKIYNGEAISDEHDKALLEGVFEQHRTNCLKACGTSGSTIYGSIDMWFQAGKWLAVYDQNSVYPMRTAEFEGVEYLIPNEAEQFLTDQYGDWMELPSKVRPSHGG